jgi:hypothetical protein
MTNVYKAGRQSKGFRTDKGLTIHAVNKDLDPNAYNISKALCGEQPGSRSTGWNVTDKEITCDKCLKLSRGTIYTDKDGQRIIPSKSFVGGKGINYTTI